MNNDTTPQVQFDPASARFGSSRSQKRLEDDRLLVGKGLFSDDRRFEGEAAMVLVRSPHAHARIRSMDLAAVRAAPGVLAVWTMADLRADGVRHIPFPPLFKRADGQPMSAPLRTPLAEERVFYVGHPVVAVVARTRAQAQDAADLAAIDYEELPCVVDARRAVEPGAPQLWAEAPSNVAGETRYGKPAEVDAAFARAAHVTGIELHNQRLIANAMEPRCAIGVHEGGRTTVYTQSQQPTGARDLLAAVFGGKPARLPHRQRRHRRRLRHEDRPADGGRAGVPTARGSSAARCAGAASGARSSSPRTWGATAFHGRARARQGRALPRAAPAHARQHGRGAGGLLGHDPADDGGQGGDIGVPRAGGGLSHAGGAHQHHGDRRLPRRRPARGQLRDGAAGGEGGARDWASRPTEIRRRNLLPTERLSLRARTRATPTTRETSRACSRHCWSCPIGTASCARTRNRGSAASCAAAACRSYLEWTGALPTETVDIEVDADGQRDGVLRHAGDGAGAGDELHAAHHRSAADPRRRA